LLLKISAFCFGLFAGIFVSNIVASAYDIVSPRNFGLGSGAAILFTGMWKQSASISSLMAIGAGFALLMTLVFALTLRFYTAASPGGPAPVHP
jgi:hypothetical protein